MVWRFATCHNCWLPLPCNNRCSRCAVTCRTCNFQWCWLCKSKYQEGHYKNGSCEQFSQDFFDEIDMTPEDFRAIYVVMNHQ